VRKLKMIDDINQQETEARFVANAMFRHLLPIIIKKWQSDHSGNYGVKINQFRPRVKIPIKVS